MQPFVVNDYPTLWIVFGNQCHHANNVVGFITVPITLLHALYISSGDYAASMNLSIYLHILFCTIYFILCILLFLMFGVLF